MPLAVFDLEVAPPVLYEDACEECVIPRGGCRHFTPKENDQGE